jgi:hypothetical protein
MMQANYSDDEDTIVHMQAGRIGFKANGCKEEHKDKRPISVVQDITKAFRVVEPGLML